MHSYLFCLHKVALEEFTRNQYKSLPTGNRSGGWTERDHGESKTSKCVSHETFLVFDHWNVLTNQNFEFNSIHFISFRIEDPEKETGRHRGQAIVL